nr:hypothetical protein [Tanacetum cinerariifolium]
STRPMPPVTDDDQVRCADRRTRGAGYVAGFAAIHTAPE